MYWLTELCRFHKITDHFKNSQFPFFKHNGQILEFEVESWQQRAKNYMREIWEELAEPEIDIGDIIITENDTESDVDPNLIRKSQSGGSIGKIEADCDKRQLQ
ncbi:unnamed protein product [Oikopleura dioica]|uniref:Uncharacterized protein n=1 Tax=Oikopleura dioica TaxID=34765 RepID=E4YSG3_OIKDI|nr:unnamed protein product [Oikopleura dioica]